MPDFYEAGEYDLAGTVVGVVEEAGVLDGRSIRSGDAVIGLASSGLHTNGYSLARRVCDPLGYDTRPPELEGASLGEALLAVHRSYLSDLDQLWSRGVAVKGIAHITGGGLIDNVPRILPEGRGVAIRRGSWPIPPIFSFLVERVGVPEDEQWRVLNMGLGLVLVVAATDIATVQRTLPEADLIGDVVDGAGVRIV